MGSSICDRIVLVIGSGGREHAIAATFLKSVKVSHVYVAPGNGGTANSSSNISNVEDLDVKDFGSVAKFCHEKHVDLVFVGPEGPLANGIVDVLSAHGIKAFGPSQAAAQIESSKSFSKQLMADLSVPTANFTCFRDAAEAKAYIESLDFDVVIKASGLAAGKGVVIPSSKSEAVFAAEQMLLHHQQGSAGDEIVVEERLQGEELSVLAFCDGYSIAVIPAAQDHKRLLDGDLGPNTGGMGAFSPVPAATPTILEAIKTTILRPVVDGLRKRGMPYRGVLYAGVMLSGEQRRPVCLEFNCRLGDPEAQVLLPLLQSDLYDIATACVDGHLDSEAIHWAQNCASAAVVVASPGYPQQPQTGSTVSIASESLPVHTSVFHAGTVFSAGTLRSSGGRVLTVSSLGADLNEALQRAYLGVSAVSLAGAQYRSDIGYRAARAVPLATTLYAEAGVNIAEGNRSVSLMKAAVESTYGAAVLSGLGSFGGLFDGECIKAMSSPVIVASTDGVGTKIKLSSMLGVYRTVGRDIVNHCVNDILVQGAEPLFFLDYVAASVIRPEMVAEVVRGAAEACKEVGCALLGGETAEMPGVYHANEFDLAGTIVGCVERDHLIDGSSISVGDAVIALPSSGLHSNGFSLARAIFKHEDMAVKRPDLGGRSLGDVLLEPHRCYLPDIRKLRGAKVEIRGLAHITGGGLTENPPRILPATASCRIDLTSWTPPPVFALLQRLGQVSTSEMLQVFNMGLGMLVFVPPDDVDTVIATLGGPERAFRVGDVVHREPDSEPVVYTGLEAYCSKISRCSRLLAASSNSRRRVRLGVLGSTSGTDLQFLLDAITCSRLNASVCVVISNRRSAYIIERARRHNVAAEFVSSKGLSRSDYDRKVSRILQQHDVDFVLLIGYMRIVSAWFCQEWSGRCVNVHPSLLPAFAGGMDTMVHEQVLEAKAAESGCTVHLVSAEVDGGDVVTQLRCQVRPDDSPDALKERVQRLEGHALVQTVQAYAAGTMYATPQNALQA